MKRTSLIFLETICCQDGVLRGLSFHNERLNRTRRTFWKNTKPWDLGALIRLPEDVGEGRYKVRVIYGEALEKVEFAPYVIRPVRSLRLVAAPADLDYDFKYADRSALNDLYARRGDCDDVLIVRDGLLTDTSYANLALFDGKEWWTPARPLLAGTRRARLLAEGRLRTADIRPEDLPCFREVRLINAMIGLEEGGEVDTFIG